MKIYNSLSKKLENFQSLVDDVLKMYVCGPTVYDRIHIGNARSIIIFDFIYRFLIKNFSDKKIVYVRNITDVDDKIIKKSLELGVSESVLVEKTIFNFHQDLEYLNCLPPTVEPRVTEEIQECIDMIQKIVQNGFGYEKDGNILFSIKKYKAYGCLSGRDISKNINLTRDLNAVDKEDLSDFVLWKKTSIGKTWSSPWGEGRPGWHIECSAMSYKYLGVDFDIHGGGLDLTFPHHENEIAQSKCANLGSGFAKYWVHNGILTINGEKMSKSLGNFITIEDLINKNINPFVIRFAILSSHYRNPLDFSEKLLHDWSLRLKYLVGLLQNNITQAQPESEVLELISSDFASNLLIQKIFEWTERGFFGKVCYALEILGFDLSAYLRFEELAETQLKSESSYQEAAMLAKERMIFKKNKQFKEADELRAKIAKLGYEIEDEPLGFRLRQKF